ncbi:unnamed protein product [Eruca vesicaria subsp. sativa]|uniref:Alpha/beta hydrolase fold-3 domain-containing protein n=1 Tax=Eruca vesicaria subsp. sativa TaxID=29727 RepID=A0ABC8J4I4_ERUVS|nr:unnamed protein product [Eruca vesicaria subsp. sativa]
MSGSSQASDLYARMGFIKNQDGTITRDPTKPRGVRAPATPDPFPQVISKDFVVNHSKSTWMRVYVPTTAPYGGVSPKKLPLVVYYHGGGFIGQGFDLEPVHDFCNRLALQSNAVIASASYRLAPEFKLPAAYDDGEDALIWIKYSADEEWIKSYADISNVFLMGSNAGGNLAYNVWLRPAVRELAPLRIRGLILHDPFFGGEKRCKSEIRNVNDKFLPPILTDIWWNLCLPDGADRDHKYSNPTVGDDMEKIGRLGWKAMVTGKVEGRALIDRQRDVAKLMKEKGVDVVEGFTDDDVLASIRTFIYSSAQLRFF